MAEQEMKIVRIRDYDDARTVLEVAGAQEFALQNAAGTERSSGFLYIKEIMDRAKKEYPDKDFQVFFDAGHSPVIAIAALNSGIKNIRFEGHEALFEIVQDVAEQTGANIVLDNKNDVLDLSESQDVKQSCMEFFG